MRLRSLLLILALGVSGCWGSSIPPAATFSPTSDPLTRLVPGGSAPILQAGTTALSALGFSIAPPAAGATRVFSEPLIIQSTWHGSPVSRRVVCGIGTAAASDHARVTQLSNTIPIELQIGYEIEPRADRTATSILFSAQGRRAAGEPLTSPTMSCTLTLPFVNELFAAIESELATALRAASSSP